MSILLRSSRTATLTLEPLSDRLAPATWTWIGQPGNGFENWTNEACWSIGDQSNGNDGYPGDTPTRNTDVARFHTLPANTRTPKIYTDTSIWVDKVEVTSSWTAGPNTVLPITVDGFLSFDKSDMTGTGALAGEGAIQFMWDGPMGLTPNHMVYGSFSVKTKTVFVDDYIRFKGDGQVGYDAGAGGRWDIGEPGFMELEGTHALGSDVNIYGTLVTGWDITSAALIHAGSGSQGTYNLKTLTVRDHGWLYVEKGTSFSLGGTRFLQIPDGKTTIAQNATFSIGDNRAYKDGGATSPKTVEVTGGKVEMYPQSTFATVVGDMAFFGGAQLDIYCPGYWQTGGGGGNAGWVEVTAGGEYYQVMFVGSGTKINFKDYTPPGANNVSQGAARFISSGSLHLGIGLSIHQRLGDFFDVGMNCGINPNADLHISGTPPAGSWFVWCEIACGGTLTGEFGSIGTPPNGWQWMAGSPHYDSTSLVLSWEETL
jgi:hypothetical protein